MSMPSDLLRVHCVTFAPFAVKSFSLAAKELFYSPKKLFSAAVKSFSLRPPRHFSALSAF
jgi:hypothetical protein